MSKQVCIDERGLSALGFCDISAPYAQHQQGCVTTFAHKLLDSS